MQMGSMRLFSDTLMWNAKLNRKMRRWYLPDVQAEDITYASPAEATAFAKLPAAYVETAEFDCLHDEGAYATTLQGAGCGVELYEAKGTMHGFDAALDSPTVKACVARRLRALGRAFT